MTEQKYSANDGVQHPHSANGANPHATDTAYSVADVAQLLNLKPLPNGKFSGAPNGTGKTKDGFILCPEGNAFTNDGDKYTSRQVAELAGIAPGDYQPCRDFAARNGSTSAPNRRPAPAPSAPKNPPNDRKTAKTGAFDWNAATKYDYHDETGALLFQVGRIDAPNRKEIRQRKPDGRGGWIYSLGDVRRVLWRLPDVLGAQWVWVCEGEKAAAALNQAFEAAGVFGPHVATTNPQGAGKWRDELGEGLTGKTVCVLPDFDAPGDKHAGEVLGSLHSQGDGARPASLCRLDLPDLPEKGDVYDWLDAGGTVETLIELAQNAPEWETEKPETAPDEWPLLSLDELFARPDPTWLIDLLFPENAVAWITASHASFKSVAALDAVMCIGTGTPFHGRDVRQGRAVYIAAEGISGIRQRAKAWLIRHQLPTPLPDKIAFIERPVQVGDAGKMATFIRQMESVNPDFLVIDTQARCSVGMDENSTADSTVFWGAIAELARATGAAILVVHHNNKSGEYRGNSNAPASVDVHLSIKRDGQKAALRCLKQKDADEENAHINFVSRVIELGTLDEKGRPQTSIILEATDEPFADEKPTQKSKTERTADAVLEVLQNLHAEKGKVTKTEWEEAVVGTAKICSHGKFYDHTKALENAGKWSWAYGNCIPKEASPKSPKSPNMDEMDEPENEKSKKSKKSSKLEKLDIMDLDEPAPLEPDTLLPGHKPTPKKRKTRGGSAEPYQAPENEAKEVYDL